MTPRPSTAHPFRDPLPDAKASRAKAAKPFRPIVRVTPGDVDAVKARLRDMGALRLAITVAAEHGVTLGQMLSRSQHKYPRLARRHLWAVLRWTLDLSYSELGAIFGLDHTSILYGVGKYEEQMARMLRREGLPPCAV